MSAPITVICVLRSGGDFRPEHAHSLHRQVTRHAPGAVFRCLSDRPDVPGFIPLAFDWPGWWAKIEAFEVPGPAVLADLDTVIRPGFGDLIEHVRGREFVALRDLDQRSPRGLATGLLGWDANWSALTQRFALNPQLYIDGNKTPRWWGDAGFVERHVDMHRVSFWQDLAPGAVASWKLNSRAEQEAAAVVCFHGNPRPWDVKHDL